MKDELQTRLSALGEDARAGRVEPTALFWLKVFADVALAEGGGEAIRSDRWVDAALAAAQDLPALATSGLPGRQELIGRYDLFRFVRLKDEVELGREELAALDWQRRYRVSLAPELAGNLAGVQAWAAETWAEVGSAAMDGRYEALAAVLDRYRAEGRSALLEALHEAQALFGGWLPRPAVERVAAGLGIPLADVYGVTEFYTMFYTEPVGRKVIRLCQDAPCAAAGAEALLRNAGRQLGLEPGQTTADGEYTLETVRCLGLCERAPAALVNLQRHGSLDPDRPEMLLAEPVPPDRPAVGGFVKVALANVGVVNPASLDDYRAQGGLSALAKAVRTMTPRQVIEEIKASKLVGRGGAAFPTGLKWEFGARNPAPRYVICNADESEPGAFKDRVLMEGDPFRVLEGVLIACYAVGAEEAFVYVRGEYGLGYRRFSEAVQQLEAAGYLGQPILGSNFRCTIRVRRGAGAYICGEESALMESIEGKRGFPRLRPPFPTDYGLWGRPTIINNVETLAKVPPIIIHGGRWYNNLGTPESAGTKLFAVSGSVLRPGVYEVPFGVPLRHLIYDLAGGLHQGRALQAVLTGGAAGKFLTPEQLDTPLSFEDMSKAGGTIGAGTIMVFDDTVDMRDMLRRIAEFFAHESCGKCYPCQMGTQRQAEIMARVARGQARPEDAATLQELGAVMTDTSICGLGQTAALAITNAQQHWPALFEPAS